MEASRRCQTVKHHRTQWTNYELRIRYRIVDTPLDSEYIPGREYFTACLRERPSSRVQLGMGEYPQAKVGVMVSVFGAIVTPRAPQSLRGGFARDIVPAVDTHSRATIGRWAQDSHRLLLRNTNPDFKKNKKKQSPANPAQNIRLIFTPLSFIHPPPTPASLAFLPLFCRYDDRRGCRNSTGLLNSYGH